jgi:hypothetical protein
VRSKISFLVITLLLFISGQVLADHTVEAVDDTLIVHLQPGYTGISTNLEDIEFNDNFLNWINLANDGQAYFTVFVSNDDTKWAMLQIMERDSNFVAVDFDEMQLNFDSMAKGGRQTAADQILTQAGLQPHAIINWRFGREETCYFKIYGVCQGYQPLVDYGQLTKSLSVDLLITPLSLPVPFDTNVKGTIDGGQKPYQTWLRYDDQLISTTSIDTIYTVDLVGGHKFELTVVDAVGDTVIVEQRFSGLKGNWALGLYGGLSSTRYAVVPMGSAAIYYREQVMFRGHGVHSLFLRQDRDYFGQDEPTFERGWGVTVGYKWPNPFWLTLGWHSEENILDAGEEAGNNLSWLDAGEIGVSYITKNLSLNLAGTYGHEKDYDKNLTTTFGIRFAVMVGNTWGW